MKKEAGSGIRLEGVDDDLNGALQDFKLGEREVMVGWSLYAPTETAARKILQKLYSHLKQTLGQAFIELETQTTAPHRTSITQKCGFLHVTS